MVVLFLLLMFHNLYYYQKFANFSFSQQHVIVVIVLFFLYLFLLSIFYFNNTLAIVVPNQDEEYFVEFVDSIWATPQGWRFNLAGSHLETGWGFQLLVALCRPITWVNSFEAVLLVGYYLLVIMSLGVYVLLHEVLDQSNWWSALGALIAPLHSLAYWTPGYAFGPNAAAIAIAPWYTTAILLAFIKPSRDNTLLTAFFVGISFMCYTKIEVLRIGFLLLGLCIFILYKYFLKYNIPLSAIKSLTVAHGLGVLIASGALVDASAWSLNGGIGGIFRLLADPNETTGAGWGTNQFPTIGTWLGTELWSFLKSDSIYFSFTLIKLFSVVATFCGIVLFLYAFISKIKNLLLDGIIVLVLGNVFFYFYIVYIKIFPYALFKLQSITSSLVVSLVIAGAASLIHYTPTSNLQSQRSRLLVSYKICSSFIFTFYIFGYLCTAFQTFMFYNISFGIKINSSEFSNFRNLVSLIMADNSVTISGQFAPTYTPAQVAVRDHPIGFRTLRDAERAGGDRVRAVLAHMLSMNNVHYFGIFNRLVSHTENINIDYTDYYIIGSNQSPLLYGQYNNDILITTEFVSLLKNRAIWKIFNINTSYSLIDQFNYRDFSFGNYLLGIQAGSYTKIQISKTCDMINTDKILLIPPGFTWYSIQIKNASCKIMLRTLNDNPGYPVIVVASTITGNAVEQFGNPTTGIGLVSATKLDDGAIQVDVSYSAARMSAQKTQLRVALTMGLIGPGHQYETDADTSRSLQTWRWILTPDKPIQQLIDGNNVRMPFAPLWTAKDGMFGLRLRFTTGTTTWIDIPVAFGSIESRKVARISVVNPVFEVPTPITALSDPTNIPFPDGSVLTRTSGDIFLLDKGHLRWIPDIKVFDKYQWDWNTVIRVSDDWINNMTFDIPVD